MIIKMKDVSVVRDGNYILNNINWKVSKGEHWGVLGLNGSGKTTLLNLVNGYITPTKGEVTVLGKRFGKYDLRELRKEIGWVSSSLQERLYVNETAKDIVLSGKFASIGLYEKVEEEEAEKALKLLDEFGCRDIAHKPYRILSQGEKQRVLIARALMSSPKLLILDEPCTGLDIFARRQLLSYIEKIGSEITAPTLIYVTHRVEEISPIFTKTLLLRKGEVHSSGYTEDILTSENLSNFYNASVNINIKEGYRIIELA